MRTNCHDPSPRPRALDTPLPRADASAGACHPPHGQRCPLRANARPAVPLGVARSRAVASGSAPGPGWVTSAWTAGSPSPPTAPTQRSRGPASRPPERLCLPGTRGSPARREGGQRGVGPALCVRLPAGGGAAPVCAELQCAPSPCSCSGPAPAARKLASVEASTAALCSHGAGGGWHGADATLGWDLVRPEGPLLAKLELLRPGLVGSPRG